MTTGGFGMAKRFILGFLVFGTALSTNLHSFTDQLTTERIIRENKEFIEFLDVCISNFGNAEKDGYFTSYQHHFNGEIAFLQSDYRRAYHSVVDSQKLSVELYNQMLTDYYIEASKNILDKLSPYVIKSKNTAARLYLSLAYRDRALSANIQKSSTASHPRHYSYKIGQYLEAIKMSRRAMRYGFLALFESQDIETKKYIYQHLFEMERESGNPFYTRFLNKQDNEIVKELSRDFKSYDEEYVKFAQDKKKELVQNPDAAKKINTEYYDELASERRVRFKYELRVAEYLRNGEFGKAEDIIRKYVTDFNFKLINATFEVIKSGKNNELAGLDLEMMKTHHLDNNNRYAKPSTLETYYEKVKISDDVKKIQNDPKTENVTKPDGATNTEKKQAN
jgi:hypothetical protein